MCSDQLTLEGHQYVLGKEDNVLHRATLDTSRPLLGGERSGYNVKVGKY